MENATDSTCIAREREEKCLTTFGRNPLTGETPFEKGVRGLILKLQEIQGVKCKTPVTCSYVKGNERSGFIKGKQLLDQMKVC
jgi:hypothetical protein